MDDINILEELGLQEVSRKTHIETKFLEYMVTKQFSKLNRINTLGFVKILKREYNLDLTSWVEEFENYKSEHKQDSSIPNQSPVFAQDSDNASSKKWIFLLILLVIAGVAFWKFDGISYVNMIKSKFVEKNITKPEENIVLDEIKESSTPVVEEKQEIIEESVVIDENKTEEQVNPQEEDITLTQEAIEEEKAEKEEENVLIVEEATEKKEEAKEETKEDENTSKVEKEAFKNALIKPKRKIWIGIIDLEKRKKSQYATKKDISIDLNIPQIIVTGHGDFILRDETGNEKSYNSKNKKYYYVDGGTITMINKKEFATYNGGKSW